MPKHKPLNRIKSSLFSRSLSLAKFSLGAGAKMAAQGLTSALQSDDIKSEKWKAFLKDQAKNLTTELGELKGSLMKAGQMLSIYGEHFFPPEANQFLKSLHQDSPPLKWSVMDQILTKNLGPEKRALLEVDPVSIGTASLGQVHKARIIETDEWIALKIQYPNVDKAIDNDLRAIKSFLFLMKLLPKDFNTEPIFKEIREMLLQETNYVLEAEATAEYGERLMGDKRFIVPRVYPEFSNKKILATSFESGVRVDDGMIQNLSQERRNRLAMNYLDLYFKEIFEWKFVQTDPHFGNYKIRVHQNGQDQIVLFDFGATRKYNDDFMIPYHRLIKAMFYNDKQSFETAAADLKFLQENDSPELKQLFSEMCFDLVEPFVTPDDPRNINNMVLPDGSYDWKETDLPQRSSRKVMKLLQNFVWRTPPREVIFLDRKAAGVFIFLGNLRARLQGRELLKKYLDKIK
jgi:predicted unusual protein kinase regulating ubiquinone biosynthesis (AarF/ABC1/UbiB family)